MYEFLRCGWRCGEKKQTAPLLRPWNDGSTSSGWKFDRRTARPGYARQAER